MKTTIDIADPLFERAKRVAAREKTTVRALVEEGLRRALEERGKKGKKFKLRNVTYGGRATAETKTWAELRDLIYEGRGT